MTFGGSSEAAAHLPDGRTRWFGIIGDPIEHSLSPRLHTAVLRLLDRNLIYLPVPVSADRLPDLFRLAPELGLLGLNVTTPYKEAAARLVEVADVATERTGMVNTVRFGGRMGSRPGIFGRGTDGEGILRYLDDVGLGQAPLAVAGFGPTARSLVHRALEEGRDLRLIGTRRPEAVREALATWSMDGGTGAGPSSPAAPAPRLPAVHSWMELAGGEAAPPGARHEAAVLPGERAQRASNPTSGRGEATPGHGAAVVGRPPSAEDFSETVAVWIWALPVLPETPAGLWRSLAHGGVVLDLNYPGDRARAAAEARSRGYLGADGVGPLCAQAALSLSFWLEERIDAGLYHRVLGGSERAPQPCR